MRNIIVTPNWVIKLIQVLTARTQPAPTRFNRAQPPGAGPASASPPPNVNPAGGGANSFGAANRVKKKNLYFFTINCFIFIYLTY